MVSNYTMPSIVLVAVLLLSCSSMGSSARYLEEATPADERPAHLAVPELPEIPKPALPPLPKVELPPKAEIYFPDATAKP